MNRPRPRLRACDLRFFLAWLMPAWAIAAAASGGAHAGIAALAVWGAIALAELVLPGGDRSPPPLDDGREPAALRWVLRGHVPLQLAMIAAGAAAAAHADAATVAGLAFAVGFVAGAQGITFAHELGHRRSRIDRALGWVLMTTVGYGHFMVEHYRGHHPRAASLHDPATARAGESLYRFLPRTLVGGLASAWRLESTRLARTGAPGWLASPLAWSTLASVAMLALAAIAWPPGQAVRVVAFLVMQAAFAVLLLECVNYIEHYGLRREMRDGRLAPFTVGHAWNADHLLTNSLLANLQRHSDHHLHPWKPYATLADAPGPRLPTGYAGCVMLAMVPPAWFAVMDRRLARWRAADVTCASPATCRPG